MPKQYEIVAVAKSVKARGTRALTDAYHLFQKPALFEGRTRKYSPMKEDGDRFPEETSIPQVSVQDVLERCGPDIVDMLDVVGLQDEGNMHARANVRLDGLKLEDVPATYLLFLEKFLQQMLTAIDQIPVLDSSIAWTEDENSGLYRSALSVVTIKTRKEPTVIVKAEATERHPAQTEVVNVDTQIGTWTESRFSSAIPLTQRDAMARRVRQLSYAVSQAREEANCVQVDAIARGEAILKWIFGD